MQHIRDATYEAIGENVSNPAVIGGIAASVYSMTRTIKDVAQGQSPELS
jgi:hypothetical protein